MDTPEQNGDQPAEVMVRAQSTGDLITLEDEEGFLLQFDRRALAAITTIEGKTEQDKVLRINCMGPALKRISKLAPCVLEVKHFLLHPVRRTNKDTGEVFLGPRLVLVTPNDETVVASSKALCDVMAYAVKSFGSGPWEPPLKLDCFPLVSASSGYEYIAGRLLPREPKPVDQKKK